MIKPDYHIPGFEDRAGAVRNLLHYFEYHHLPVQLQEVSRPCAELAYRMVEAMPDSAELTTGLRKLLEAKDCFVRGALDMAPVE